MGYVVLTGNEEFAKATKRQGGYELPVQVSSVVDETCWAIYEGDTRVTEPRPLTQTMRADIRTALRDLGVVPDASPVKAEPVPVTAPPARQPKAKPEPVAALADLPTYVPVTDEETGEVVRVDGPMVTHAMHVHAQVEHHWQSGWRHLLSLGLALKTVVDGRLYLALGLPSLEAYANKHFDSSRYWVYDRVAIAAKLQEAGIDPIGVDSGQQFPSISKLRAAMPLPAEQYASLIRGGLPGPSGEAKPAAEMTVAEIRTVVKEHVTGPHPAEAEALKAKEETQAAIKLVEEAEKKALEFERQKDAADKRAADATKQASLAAEEAKQAQTEVAELRSNPVIQKVSEPTPEMIAEMDRLRATMAQTERRLNELLQLSGGKEELRKEIQQLEETKRQTRISLANYAVRFDDTGRDPRGGAKLEDALAPLFEATPRILGETLKLRRNGIGGECNEDRIRALVPQLRDLVNELDGILKDRQTRHITIIHSEVQ